LENLRLGRGLRRRRGRGAQSFRTLVEQLADRDRILRRWTGFQILMIKLGGLLAVARLALGLARGEQKLRPWILHIAELELAAGGEKITVRVQLEPALEVSAPLRLHFGSFLLSLRAACAIEKQGQKDTRLQRPSHAWRTRGPPLSA